MARQTSQDRARATRRKAAAEAAHRRQARKRAWMAGAVAILVLVVIGGVALGGGGGKPSSIETTATTIAPRGASTTAAVPSAAGKPCLAVSDPLPAGAPNVPVQTGPPPSSLVVQDLTPGTGADVVATSTLTVNYIGVSCSTGKVFDSSYKTGQPATFPLAQVIPGWQQGLVGMKVGGQRLLGIPPDQGYGTDGRPPTIAPSETLWFVVEVVDAK
ncbi:MAG: FKBP-type peptidyl-prolyl cis-trans isomerase [Acidimicrobiales bacterium]